jgi:hypothetical protein
MYRHRKASLIMFTLLLLAALGFATQAQQARPLPHPSLGIVANPTAIAPNEVHSLQAVTSFVWSHTGADKYVLKLKVLGTGQVIKYKYNVGDPGVACAAQCVVHSELALFDEVTDDQDIKWRVIAKITATGDKAKGAWMNTMVEEVVAPDLDLPGDLDGVVPGSMFAWPTAHDINDSYILRIVEKDTGVQVFKESYNVVDICGMTCELSFEVVWGALDLDTEYEWRVTAIGLTGEKATSQTRQFHTPYLGAS